jgi:NADH-quinone oxidoreductase subunit M
MTEFSGVLTGILAFPFVGAIVILFLNKESKEQARIIAAFATLASLVLSAFVFFSYDTDQARADNIDRTTSEEIVIEGEEHEVSSLEFYYVDRFTWIEELGISYQLGADGLVAAMILLTGLASFGGVLISWGIEDRPREFMAFFLLLVAGVYGVFMSTDIFLLLFFYELAIFPMYLLIAGWGWKDLREYASMKLTLYILIGSIVALVGLLVLYFQAGAFFTDNAEQFQDLQEAGVLQSETEYSFDFNHLYVAAQAGAYDVADYLGIDGLTMARFWFPAVFIGFGVLAGLFPFHNWSPDGHVAAPTAVSMIHAGVLMKLGAYAALRLGVQLMPDGARVHLPWIIFLALINVVYGAFIAFRQRDFKYVIGFSSVSHMGLVSLGFATMNVTGLTGAGLQMFSHGVMTALFFACVGMVYDRAHTRDIPSLGGFIHRMPMVGIAFILGGLVSMGMPGLSGFVAEFPILIGVWKGIPEAIINLSPTTLTEGGADYYGLIVVVAVLGIILTASYVLRVVGDVFFGKFDDEKFPEVNERPLRWQDRAALLLLSVWLIALGVYPQLMSGKIESTMQPIVNLLTNS